MLNTGRASDEVRETQVRTAAELAPLARPRVMSGGELPPHPYVRRYVVEHAAGGQVLDSRLINGEFLPYVDAPRLRAVGPAMARTADHGSLEMLATWRRCAHSWTWNRPGQNRDALKVGLAVSGAASSSITGASLWSPRWARWALPAGEILSRLNGPVAAVAALVLPDGRPIAITGSHDDTTVRVWDLSSGIAIGHSLEVPGVPRAIAVTMDGAGVGVIVGGSGGVMALDLDFLSLASDRTGGGLAWR